MVIIVFILLLATQLESASSFHVGVGVVPSSSSSITSLAFALASSRRGGTGIPNRVASTTALSGLFDFLGGGEDDSGSVDKIPPALQEEIFNAEANTPAAIGRQQRIVIYVLLTFVGVTVAFANAFLSELRYGPSADLGYYGFGWVENSFIAKFLFMNKLGGALGLLSAGLSGTLVEVEVRSKKENVEKIWAEMQRRQSVKESGTSKKKKARQMQSVQSSTVRRDRTGRQKKRLSALEELLDGKEEEQTVNMSREEVNANATAGTKAVESSKSIAAADENTNDGILGAIAGFYKKADSMAASQALLLNKELEDWGILEKITDETGLKIL